MLIYKDYKNLIKEVLKEFAAPDFYTNLILGTTAVESDFGEYRRQIGFTNTDKAGNPKKGGYGVNQIEINTHNWLVYEYAKNKNLKDKVQKFFNSAISLEDNLILNDKYNVAICYLKYLSCSHLFEPPVTTEDCAKIWKKYYNTALGKGKVEKYIDAYETYCH